MLSLWRPCLGLAAAAATLILLVVFLVVPILVGVVALVTKQKKKKQHHFHHSKLYVGRVWHNRFLPKKHSFTYPIFMFVLDLEEDFADFLWPVVQFRVEDHLKNGEGLLLPPQQEPSPGNSDKNGMTAADTTTKSATPSLADRICNLVVIKTQSSFQPTTSTHRILLMTHLCYYGYNFNPVSFYYVVNKKTDQLEAIIGEVSNTPWTEMHCYCLHCKSTDQVQTKQTMVGDRVKHDFTFPKMFHVSPFMEMEYWYDWSFVGCPPESSVTVINSMRCRSDDRLAFTAKLTMEAMSMNNPMNVLWQILRYPVFCMMIQVWIHYQAFWLFAKGIVYVPHPEGSETKASQTIAAMMTPFFAMRDYWNSKSKTE